MRSTVLSLAFCLLLFSCGYHFREAENVPLKRYKVRRVYMVPPNNMMTYSSGLDLRLFNALKKRFEACGQIDITEDRNEAQAFLHIDLLSGGAAAGNYGPVDFGNNPHNIFSDQKAWVSARLWLERNEGKIGHGYVFFKEDYGAEIAFRNFPMGNVEHMSASHLGNQSEMERGQVDAVERLAIQAELGLLRLF